jgi:2-succinyl-6-hydroxy-2,4-cyclohexadiene-1-carboxylate synthase
MLSVYGHPNSPPVVLFHGFLGNRNDWLSIVTALKDRWYCIVPDLPGHGKRIDHDLNQMMEEITTLIKTPFHLIAYSLGGRLAIKLAHDRPELIASLCLESAHPGLRTAQDKKQRILADARWASRFKHEPIEAVLRDWYKQPVFSTLSQPKYKQQIEHHNQQAIEPLIKMFEQTGLGEQASYWYFLAHIKIPILYISGQNDHKFSKIGSILKANSKNVATQGYIHHIIIEDASHNCHLDNSEQFIIIIKSFLSHLNSKF